MTIVVSDTSPLHYLILCKCETLLPKLFDQVFIPPTVFSELQHPNAPPAVQAWIKAQPDWLVARAPVTIDQSVRRRQSALPVKSVHMLC